MSLNEERDELIKTCWDRIAVNSNSNGFIFVEKVLELIAEMENILQHKGLFTTDEIKLLRLMIKDKPLLKLYKMDISRFLLRLVQYTDFETFLNNRANISASGLRRLLRSDRLKSYNGSTDMNRVLTPTTSYNIANQSRIITPPISPNLKSRYRSSFTPNHPEKSNGTISDRLYRNITNGEPNSNIPKLEAEIKRLNQYIKTLENRHSERTYDRQIKELLKESKIKEKKTNDLEKLCERYQKEMLEYQVMEEKKKPIINNLLSSLQRQDQLIESLKTKLELRDDNRGSQSDLKSLLRNLPILKQYHLYFKYKNQQKNFGLLAINIFTLFLSAVIFLHLVRLLLYFLLWIVNVRVKNNNYIFDDYLASALKAESTFTWWREISWLEYSVITIHDWIHG